MLIASYFVVVILLVLVAGQDFSQIGECGVCSNSPTITAQRLTSSKQTCVNSTIESAKSMYRCTDGDRDCLCNRGHIASGVIACSQACPVEVFVQTTNYTAAYCGPAMSCKKILYAMTVSISI